jgi:hypothetical protein
MSKGKYFMKLFMKLFVKILCLFIPLKAWRKKVRKFFYKDISFIPHISIAQSFLNKKRTFDKKVRVIETVSLGSSHCEFGFNHQYMSSLSFNYGLTSLDLYSCFMLYKFFCKKAARLKNVALFYSVFSNGYELEKQS